jgi:hypothetical protein
VHKRDGGSRIWLAEAAFSALTTIFAALYRSPPKMSSE